MIVSPVQNPNFVRHARGRWAQRIVVALHIDNTLPLLFILAHNVAEDAAFALSKPFAGGIQLVFDTPRDKNCSGNLRMRVRPLVARQQALILEQSYILETRILL